VINHHLTTLAVALRDLDAEAPHLQSWGTSAASVLLAGGRLLACGTDGSAEQAEHLASSLARREDDRPPLAAAALTAERPGVPAATSASEPQRLAARVRSLGRPGDILFCICASGTDSDVSTAADEARAARRRACRRARFAARRLRAAPGLLAPAASGLAPTADSLTPHWVPGGLSWW